MLHRAEELAVRSCMAGRGFPYEIVPEIDRERLAAANPYGLLDVQRARSDGYGITGHLLANAGNPAATTNDALVADLPDAQRQRWNEALIGTEAHRTEIRLPDGQTLSYSTDGCVQIAQASVYGEDGKRLYSTVESLSAMVTVRVADDPRVGKAEREWAACMREHDYRYSGLSEPPAEVRERLAAAEQDPAEVREVATFELAVAGRDAVCQRDARLHDAVRKAQADAERDIVVDRYRGDLDRLRTLRRQALDRAATMTATATAMATATAATK